MTACRHCGAYGGSPHTFACQPTPRRKPTQLAHVRASSRRSAAIRKVLA